MSSELLEREEEYRKLNEKLELRSKEILKEFENVLKKQDDILQEASLKAQDDIFDSFLNKKVRSKINLENDVEIDPNLVPKSVDEMGAKGMSQFYKTKIKTMQNSYEKLQIEYKMKSDELRNTLAENKRLIEEKERWFTMNNASKSQVNKLENQMSTLNSKLQAKESENLSLKKEVEQLKKELRNVSQNSSGNEVKINRLLEENEKLKTAIQNSKKEEADLKMQHRKHIDQMTSVIKGLEKQKLDVVAGFKKQMLLVDNLKRQKALYETQKFSEIADKDFMKILDWNRSQ
ncbi:testis-expressed protein 9 [Agrilus planipennis]|uniref:Testis-expressed protein 9 n=1 Tax=Agrilus planipennis TaxID=224129 RepID=A0A1W4W328_AGRPL|nr:testis-expressed protein 9 [Agrilus planipennis]